MDPRPASLPFPAVLTAAALVAAAAACAEASRDQLPDTAASSSLPEEAQATVARVDPEECAGGAYLCEGLARRDGRVLRWDSATPLVRVHVPLPPVEPPALARDLQDAAVAGFLAWQDKPFPLQVSRTAGDGADITVQWVERLDGAELGRAETRWTREADGNAFMRVTRFALVLRNPLEPSRYLERRQVRITAAHEMGHALGLPHSDSPRDVMYATNTATALSPGDYRAMAALYRLANGAYLPDDSTGSAPQSSR